ncbi:F0F1 ATP synthase subunit B [Sneathiella litorea]|uniref:ATP synthase subunit b n=1 Tax=Sneathiella litorea TaxID=2606216 RepID=A0A6L8W3W9_9PROT|nr:F0F1 ATP synthase subunit B [Sneathiella litorea]MZR29212.1 F0F1 ATP synthase subunit B [Sneathiella litorea]
MLHDPTFWVAVAFVGFLGVLVYFKVPPLIAKQLDARADKIHAELEEAKKLREDAQSLFADYQRRQHDALQTAEDIVARAKEDAEILRKESIKELEATLMRRQELAEIKIRQAEEKAIAEVQGIAVDVAIAAATKLMQDGLKKDKADALIDQSIKSLETQLN